MSEMMTTYFPSFLLMMITYATTFFKPFFFEAALSVNLTTMLVMTTIFISKMEGLPPTSVTKMIDYWLILCQLVPFTQVVLLTAMEYLKEDQLDREDSQVSISSLRLENEEDVQLETKEAWIDLQEKRNKVTFLPMLLTMGKFHSKYKSQVVNLSPEEKVLPLTVVISFIVYFGIAASFYFEESFL